MEHKMDIRHKGHKQVYNTGDLVKVHVAKIDRGPGDCNVLPCKIVKALPNNMYNLACQFGVLENVFAATEILPLGPLDFPELESPPMDTVVTLVEAARLQSGALSGNITCSCKGKCLSGKCHCKKTGVPCGSGCHPKNKICKNRS
jgi:hypothetical protein